MATTGNNVGMDATKDKEFGTPEHDKLMLYISKKENYSVLIPKTSKTHKILETSFELEKPIYKNDNYLVGIADAVINYKGKIYNEKTRKWHLDISTSLIEIKPTIKNIGEVIRQIKLYATTINENNYREMYGNPIPPNLLLGAVSMYLLTNDYLEDDIRNCFNEQGIVSICPGFIEYLKAKNKSESKG